MDREGEGTPLRAASCRRAGEGVLERSVRQSSSLSTISMGDFVFLSTMAKVKVQSSRRASSHSSVGPTSIPRARWGGHVWPALGVVEFGPRPKGCPMRQGSPRPWFRFGCCAVLPPCGGSTLPQADYLGNSSSSGRSSNKAVVLTPSVSARKPAARLTTRTEYRSGSARINDATPCPRAIASPRLSFRST